MEELLALHGLTDAEAAALLAPIRRTSAPPDPSALSAAVASAQEGLPLSKRGVALAGVAELPDDGAGASSSGAAGGAAASAAAESEGGNKKNDDEEEEENDDEDDSSGPVDGGDEGRRHGSRRPRRRISFVGRILDPGSGTYSSLRLFGGRHGYSTAITRSIGDRDAARCCTAEPEITTVVVEPQQTARVIASSDGVWDVHSNWEAFAVAKRPLLRGNESTHVRSQNDPPRPLPLRRNPPSAALAGAIHVLCIPTCKRVTSLPASPVLRAAGGGGGARVRGAGQPPLRRDSPGRHHGGRRRHRRPGGRPAGGARRGVGSGGDAAALSALLASDWRMLVGVSPPALVSAPRRSKRPPRRRR